MPINLNGYTNIQSIYFNNTALTDVYYNNVKVWAEINYFYIECLNNYAGAYVYLVDGGSGYYPDLLYSTDKITWSTFDTTPVSMNTGDKIYIKAGVNGTQGINNAVLSSGFNKFSFNGGTYAIGGDITTLITENGGITDLSNVGTGRYCFGRFCQDESTIISIANLVLPSVIGHTSFHYGFYNSGIQDFPDMSGITSLEYNCFGSCFRDTPATGTVYLTGIQSYNNAFGETYQYAFNHGFRNSGITAVVISSTTPINGAFNSAFYQCSSLTSITVGWTDWSNGTYQNWVRDISGSGTFTCPVALGDNSTIARGNNYCPNNWTVVNI